MVLVTHMGCSELIGCELGVHAEIWHGTAVHAVDIEIVGWNCLPGTAVHAVEVVSLLEAAVWHGVG